MQQYINFLLNKLNFCCGNYSREKIINHQEVLTTESVQGRKVPTGNSLIAWKIWTVCTANCNGRMAFFAIVLQNLNFNPSISFILTQDYSWHSNTLIFHTHKRVFRVKWNWRIFLWAKSCTLCTNYHFLLDKNSKFAVSRSSST